MPFLAPLFGAIGSILAGLGVTWSSVIGVLLNVGVSLLQSMMKKDRKADDLQGVFRQSVPVRTYHAGRIRTGGSMWFLEVRNRIFYGGVYFGEGKVSEFREYFVDGRPALIDKDGYVISDPYGNKIIRIYTRAGSVPSTPYKALIDAFPGVVTKTWRGDGLVTGLVVARSVGSSAWSKIYPNRWPALNVVADFAAPYDPRTGKRVFTENVALFMRYYLTHPKGCDIPAGLMDDDDFAAAANACDQWVTTRDGSKIRRYHGTLTWKSDEKRRDVIDRINLMCDGWLYLKPNGKIGYRVDTKISPAGHIGYEHVRACNLRLGGSPASVSNEVVVKYTNPNANYTQTTCKPWQDTASIRKMGERKTLTIEAPGIKTHNHARRIAKIVCARSLAKWTGTVETDLYGLRALRWRYFTMDIDPLGIREGLFECLGWSLDDDGLSVTLQVAMADPNRIQFDAAKEEGESPPDPTSIQTDAIPDPDDFRATIETRTASGVKLVQARLSVRLQSDFSTENSKGKRTEDLDVEFQYALASSEDWEAGGYLHGGKISRNEQHGWTRLSAVVTDIDDGSRYDFRARYLASDGTPGEWEVIAGVKAVASSKAAALPKSAAVTVSPLGATQYRVTFTAPNDPLWAAAAIYVASSATGVKTYVDAVYCAPSADAFFDSLPLAAGTLHLWLRSINPSGIESTGYRYAGAVTL